MTAKISMSKLARQSVASFCVMCKESIEAEGMTGGGDARANGTESQYTSCFIPPSGQFHIK